MLQLFVRGSICFLGCHRYMVVSEVALGDISFGDVVAGQPVAQMGGQTYH